MTTSTLFFARVGILGAVCAAAALAVAAPIPKFVGAQYENGKLVGTVKTGATQKKMVMPNQSERRGPFLIGEKGAALLYPTPSNGKGGYENEKAGVARYLAQGEFYVLMEAPLRLNSMREYRSRRGRTAYVISMQDGGAGIPYVYVCSTQGQTWDKRATRVAGVRNGKLILKQYVDGEESGLENAKPIRTLYLDLDSLLDSKS